MERKTKEKPQLRQFFFVFPLRFKRGFCLFSDGEKEEYCILGKELPIYMGFDYYLYLSHFFFLFSFLFFFKRKGMGKGKELLLFYELSGTLRHQKELFYIGFLYIYLKKKL